MYNDYLKKENRCKTNVASFNEISMFTNEMTRDRMENACKYQVFASLAGGFIGYKRLMQERYGYKYDRSN